MDLVKKFFVEEEGQDLAEYGMLIALIAIAVIVAVGLIGTNLNTFFQGIADEIGTWAVPGSSE